MKMNHGYYVYTGYQCTDAYKLPENGDWSSCPHCNLVPKVWRFDNGLHTACGCGNSQYDHFSVRAESIMSVHKRTSGKGMDKYNSDQLRMNWNEYCSTMINPCSHGDLNLEGKW